MNLGVVMTENIVSFNKAKKAKLKRDNSQLADENARKHGRKKSEKLQEAERGRRANIFLDGHKRDE